MATGSWKDQRGQFPGSQPSLTAEAICSVYPSTNKDVSTQDECQPLDLFTSEGFPQVTAMMLDHLVEG